MPDLKKVFFCNDTLLLRGRIGIIGMIEIEKQFQN